MDRVWIKVFALGCLSAGVAGCVAPSEEPAAPALADQTDLPLIATARADALDQQALGVAINWQNPANGHRGTVTTTLAYTADDGAACRELIETATAERETAFAFKTACRVGEDGWSLIDPAAAPATVARLRQDLDILPDWRSRGLWVYDPWIGYGPRTFPFGFRDYQFGYGPPP